VGLDAETYLNVHEPWLERLGLIERTPEGRIATEKARELYGDLAVK
jgi:Holliday junction resolvasome RuvABC ATP-dependent DNA helicase subunit